MNKGLMIILSIALICTGILFYLGFVIDKIFWFLPGSLWGITLGKLIALKTISKKRKQKVDRNMLQKNTGHGVE